MTDHLNGSAVSTNMERNMPIGWINMVRADVVNATKECMATKRLGKDYNVLWWVGRGPIPLHWIKGGRYAKRSH